MRALVIFCLSLFFFLTKGNDFASAAQISKAHNHVQFTNEIKYAHIPFHKTTNLHLQKDLSSGETTDVEESQDDDSISRIAIVHAKPAANCCYIQFIGNDPKPTTPALPYCSHFSYTSSFKYLLLRVFRI